MTIQNVLASVPVTDLEASIRWYAAIFERRPDKTPMPEVAEWAFPRGGWLQVYAGPERAGHGSFTLAVDDLDASVRKLAALGIDTSKRVDGPHVRTVMIKDPDGNSIAFAQAKDDAVAR